MLRHVAEISIFEDSDPKTGECAALLISVSTSLRAQGIVFFEGIDRFRSASLCCVKKENAVAKTKPVPVRSRSEKEFISW